MIEFIYETDFKITNSKEYTNWLKKVIISEDKVPGNLCFILSTDQKVLEINQKYLKHTDYTDVITFDYTDGNEISGDIFISYDRIKDNANRYQVRIEEELRRVMVHGVLHLMGYSDKSETSKREMKSKEDEKMIMFHVEQ